MTFFVSQMQWDNICKLRVFFLKCNAMGQYLEMAVFVSQMQWDNIWKLRGIFFLKSNGTISGNYGFSFSKAMGQYLEMTGFISSNQTIPTNDAFYLKLCI